MIEDLDGGDISPSRAPTVRAISVVLVLAAIGWATLQSPELRGPYATPDPSGGVSLAKLDQPRYTLVPFAVIEPASVGGSAPGGCVVPGSAFTTTFFLGGQSATFTRPISVSPNSSCVFLWSSRTIQLVPSDSFAR